MTSASDNGGWSEDFGYDRYGNVWLSAAAGGVPAQMQMATAASDFDALTNRRVGGTYIGDNQTILGSLTLSYDAENRQV